MPNNYFRIRTRMRGHKTSNNKPTLEPDERTRGPVKINSLRSQIVKNPTAMTGRLSQAQHPCPPTGGKCADVPTLGPITPPQMIDEMPKPIKLRSGMLHQRERARERRHRPPLLKTADLEGTHTSASTDVVGLGSRAALVKLIKNTGERTQLRATEFPKDPWRQPYSLRRRTRG
jgi:hypothetical protein